MIVERTEISGELALRLVSDCVRFAGARGWEVCAAVCDPRGALVALLRTDHVVMPAIEFAIDKAYTAATLKTSTQDFFKRAESRPALKLGLANRPRILVFPGGYPVFHDDVCIGGLGVSGAQDQEDVECAVSVIEGAGLQIKHQAGP
jgi:uncharacterized protein GlcG (DUF336 family)